ncbi:MAG: response regulator transcription factor, partial [Chloroflexi bacterium]|nr:response regulator transcription factor [Chloroflexota bacterium]
MNERLRLLIVDNSQASRKELGDLLSGESHLQVIGTARHGLEALRLVEKHKPDVVLLEQNIPGLTGAEVARRLKAANPATRIFFVSADAEAKELAMAAGAEAFFVKGVDSIRLLQALRVAHSPPSRMKRSLRLPRRKKAAPKIVPWLSAVLRISVLGLIAGIVLTRGTLLAYISLISGIFFFVYAMKYYVSMGLIMLATIGNGNGNGNGKNGHINGNGLKNGKRLNGLRNGNGHNGNGNGNGARERLKKQPFV